ncbi:NAD-dependent epimerase/dehydratase family protein [Chloroflexota bacterium]
MSWTGKKVAVTGAAGFLGSHLCEALVAKGTEVVALDNFNVGPASNIEGLKDKMQIVACDITKDDIRGYLKDSQIVFHLASLANPRSCSENFDLAFGVNLVGTKNVLDASTNCERAIFMSAAANYGDPSYIPIDEKHPLNATDPYAITKIMAEYLCKNYFQNYGVPVVIARNFSTFGPRQTPAYIIPTLITQALQQERIEIWNPKPTRDFMYVDNTIDALLRIAECEELTGDVVNIGSGDEIQIGALAEKVSQMFGGIPVVNLNKEVLGSKRLVCDNTKLKKVTGWKLNVSFEDGIQKTCDWFRQASLEQ